MTDVLRQESNDLGDRIHAANGKQRPSLTIEAGELNVRVDDSIGMAAGGALDLRGSLTRLNNGGKPLAIVGSLVQPLPASAGSGAAPNTSQIVTGSQTILAN